MIDDRSLVIDTYVRVHVYTYNYYKRKVWARSGGTSRSVDVGGPARAPSGPHVCTYACARVYEVGSRAR